jgi:hypothetical protein
MVVEEEKLVVFLNDQLLIHLDNLDLLGDKNYFTFNSDIEQGTILILDDIRYWNLEEHDIEDISEWTPQDNYNALLSFMESNSPTFEDDFSTQKPEWEIYNSENEIQPLENFIVDEILDPLDSSLIVKNSAISANRFIYAFDFLTNINGDPNFSINLLISSDESRFLSLSSEYSPSTEDYIWVVTKITGNEEERLAEGWDEPMTITDELNTLIINNFRGSMDIYIQDEYLGNFNTLDLGGNDTSLQINSGNAIDNFRFWNLDGVDFDLETEIYSENSSPPQEPTPTSDGPFSSIQDFMNSTPPTFEDDFTDFNPEWGSGHSEEIGEFPISGDENSGVLKFPASLGRFSFPYTSLIDAEDFILTYEISPQDDFGHCCFEFRATNDSLEKYQFCIDVDSINKADFQSSFRRRVETSSKYYDAQKLNYLSSNKFYKITIVAKDNDIYIYFDEELIHHITGYADTPGSINRFSIDQKIDETAADAIYFDNLKFWNLEVVDFNLDEEIVSEDTHELEDPTAEVLPDFIQTFIETTPPGFEEDFTDDYLSTWGYGNSMEMGDFTLASIKSDDELRFNSDLDQFSFPSSDILNGEDFLLTFEILPREALQSLDFQFRVSEYLYNNDPHQITDSGYNLQLTFAGNGYSLQLSGWGEADYSSYSAKRSFIYSKSPNNFDEVMIYAKDNTIMVFLNGELVFDATDKASITGRYSKFRVQPNGKTGYVLYFDNVKYWNLKWADIHP